MRSFLRPFQSVFSTPWARDTLQPLVADPDIPDLGNHTDDFSDSVQQSGPKSIPHPEPAAVALSDNTERHEHQIGQDDTTNHSFEPPLQSPSTEASADQSIEKLFDIEDDLETVVYPKIGVDWEVHQFDATPKWIRDPTVESIIQVLKMKLGSDKDFRVEKLWDGSYNKFYSVDLDDKEYVMKVTLPVLPRTKTESEVTTLRWTAKNTNLSCLVPEVIDYSSSANNPIGCEWILMTRLEGIPLSSCWRDVTIGSKERMVRALAEYSVAVYRNQFKQIGSLFQAPLPCRGRRYQVGKISSMRLFWHRGLKIENQQGPFGSTKEWSLRRLNIAHEHLSDRFRVMQHWPRHERGLIWRMLSISGVDSRLWRLYEALFPRPENQEDHDHEVIAIGRPKLLTCPRSPVSDTSSEMSWDDMDTDDTELQTANNSRECSPDKSSIELGLDNQRLPTPDSEPYNEPHKQVAAELGAIGDLTPPHMTASTGLNTSLEKQTKSQQVAAGATDITQNNPRRISCNMDNWEPGRPDAKKRLDAVANQEIDAEPTMLWHDNLSTDNILVDPETGRLTGILDWDCVSCLPVPIACDWPAFLHEGKHRVTEPDIEKYTIWVPDEDGVDDIDMLRSDYEPLTDNRPGANRRKATASSRRAKEPTFQQKKQQKGHVALQANYWRDLRDFELTYLRKAFMQEMVNKCPQWYETWRTTKVRKDYEAAVQNCDDECLIGKVEAWCDAVEQALQKGLEIRPPHVMSLHCAIFEGVDCSQDCDELDHLGTEWTRSVREREKQVEQWRRDLNELDDAKKSCSNAKGNRTRTARLKAVAERAMVRAREELEKALPEVEYLTNLDEQGLDVQELDNLRYETQNKLTLAQAAIPRAEDQLERITDRANTAEERCEAAEARELAALEKIHDSEYFQKFHQERTFNHQTWRNLEKALYKEYGDKTWWKHRLEPLGECRKHKDFAAHDRSRDDVLSDEESPPDRMDLDAEEPEISEEE